MISRVHGNHFHHGIANEVGWYEVPRRAVQNERTNHLRQPIANHSEVILLGRSLRELVGLSDAMR